MSPFVLLDEGRPMEVDVTIDQGDVWIDSTGVDSALGWARKLAGQAPLAVSAIKGISNAPHLDKGLDDERDDAGASPAK